MNVSDSKTRGRGRAISAAWRRRAWRPAVAAVALACLLGAAAAQLDVDAAGGPLTLQEEVAAALAAWEAAFADELTEPTATFGFAPDLVGPDTASLTLRWEDGRTEVLLAPARYRTGPVLLHEIGVLLGLPEVGPGVMDPVLTAEAPAAPTAEDVALLRDLFTYPRADLTRDGAVDFYDLAAFGAAYGSVGINLRADLTGDGRVDDADLTVLREAYAFAAPSTTPPESTNLTLPESTPDATPEPATGEGQAPASDDAPANETQDDADEPDAGSESDDVQDEDSAAPDEEGPDAP